MSEADEKPHFQFSLKTMMFATVIASVATAAPLLAVRAFEVLDPYEHNATHSPWFLIKVSLVVSPLWLPLVFVGYAIGKQSISARFILALLLAEAIGFCLLWTVFPYTRG